MGPIPAMDLIVGMVYRVRGRNIKIAVYAGQGRFIGIREKFGNRFLDLEEFGQTIRFVGDPVDSIPPITSLTATLPARCRQCRKRCWWTGPPSPAPWACPSGCPDVDPVAWRNRKLFRLLSIIEKAEGR